ncbi:MAG TPA: PAS domain S-box protein [Methylophilaceae bacterium]|jgi:PAS domain S-box-containing protein
MINFELAILENIKELEIIPIQYNLWLVGLSVLIAIMTSTLAIQLGNMAQKQTSKFYKQISVISGAVALGAGVWSMHFIGMMALNLCTKVNYNVAVTALSMLPAIFASLYALNFISADSASTKSLIVGGVLVGLGIGGMHYIGIYAMEMEPRMKLQLSWLLISVVIAVLLSILALWVGIHTKSDTDFSTKKSFIRTLTGGSILGLAISGMHYAGMHASLFIGKPDLGFNPALNHSVSFSLGITLVTILIGVLAASINAMIHYRHIMEEIKIDERRLSVIFETATDAIITFDARGKIMSFNGPVHQMFEWDASEITLTNIRMLIQDYDEVATMCELNHSDGYQSSVPTRISRATGLKKTGKEFPIKISLGHVELNGVDAYVAFISDLTQQHAYEAAMRDRDIQIQSLMNNMPGVAFQFINDHSHTPLLMSPSIETLTGYQASEFISGDRKFRDLMKTEDLHKLRNIINQAILDKSSYAYEYRVTHRNGQERWVSEAGSVMLGEGANEWYINGVIIDITDSKRINAEYQSIVTAIHRSTSIVEYTTDGIITNANQIFLDLVEFTKDEVIGQHHAIFCAPGDAQTERYKNKWSALKRGQFVEGEFLRYGKNGKKIWIHASYNPLLNEDGVPVKVLLFMMDISTRKQMEIALTESKEKAEIAANSKAAFLANMSHEIRTPMNAIIGFSEIMADTDLDGQQKKYLQSINSSAKSLLRLLNDILDSAKLEKGKLEFNKIDFSLDQLVDEVISTLWIQARKKKLELLLEIAPEASGYYLGDPDRIRQVLINIVGNAIKFTLEGHVKLKVSYQGNIATLEVTDTGIGISKDRISAIFEPFTQADSSMSRRFGGTGLGTTISKQLIDAMGGTISVTSELGVGSCFTIEIPLNIGKKLVSISSKPTTQIPKLDILIADDIPLNLELLSILLTQDGHTVSTASNGQEALDLAKSKNFDLLILDVQMPEKDGLTAARELRVFERANNLPHKPIIALTASVLQEDRVAALEAGMNGFASKPVDHEELTKQISYVLFGNAPEPVTENETESTAPAQILNFKVGVKRWGNAKLYIKELHNFSKNQSTNLTILNDLITNTKNGQLKAHAHACKGVAANLSIELLRDAYAAIEVTTDTESQAKLNELAQLITQQWQAFERELELLAMSDEPNAIATESTLVNDAYDSVQLEEFIGRIIDRANKGQFDSADLEAIRAMCSPELQLKLTEVTECFDDFEFQRGIEVLVDIQQNLSKEGLSHHE